MSAVELIRQNITNWRNEVERLQVEHAKMGQAIIALTGAIEGGQFTIAQLEQAEAAAQKAVTGDPQPQTEPQTLPDQSPAAPDMPAEQ